jgi:hypothetical protein
MINTDCVEVEDDSNLTKMKHVLTHVRDRVEVRVWFQVSALVECRYWYEVRDNVFYD